MRRLAPVVALCLLAACASPERERPVAPEDEAPPASEPTSAPETTRVEESASLEETPTSPPPETTAARPADAAPDFSLELGDGGTFVLSEEARPVFLVFWAEW